LSTTVHYWTRSKAHASTLHPYTPSLQYSFNTRTIVFGRTSSGSFLSSFLPKSSMHFTSLLAVLCGLCISFQRIQTLKSQCHYFIKPQFPVPSPQSPVPSPQSPVPSPKFPVPNPKSPVPRQFLSYRLSWTQQSAYWIATTLLIGETTIVRNLPSMYEFPTMHAEHCRYKTCCVKSNGSFLKSLFQIR
jgi:hypothetical protein